MANQNTFYTDKEIRDSQNIALSAWLKYEAWYEQYSKEKAEALISRWENNNAIKLNSDGTYTRI